MSPDRFASSASLLAEALGIKASAAAKLIEDHGGSLRRVAEGDVTAYAAVPGIGPTKASRLAAVCQLARRIQSEPFKPGDRIRGPQDVFNRLGSELWGRKQEEFHVIYMSSQNRVIESRCITVGLLNSSLVHPREIFRPAIQLAAASIIVAHNHPSGDPDPSSEDVAVTVQLVESGRLLGIPVRDHVIIGADSFVSLLDLGLMSGAEGGAR